MTSTWASRVADVGAKLIFASTGVDCSYGGAESGALGIEPFRLLVCYLRTARSKRSMTVGSVVPRAWAMLRSSTTSTRR